MKKLMSLLSRRELLRSITQRYRAAGRKDKQRILDEFVEATGYHRKYAVALLNQTAESPLTTARKPRHQKRRYSDDVKAALLAIWKAANRLCSKRLVPFLPEFIPVLEKYGHLLLADEVREKLLQVSPATVDRLLKETRRTSGRSVGATVYFHAANYYAALLSDIAPPAGKTNSAFWMSSWRPLAIIVSMPWLSYVKPP